MEPLEEYPIVSIVTPSFNQDAFLEATMRSVLEQDYPRIEYIICDGGSTDSSTAIIRKYEDRLAWWCSEADAGQSEAINKGIARASGSIVAWLNSDDCLKPGAVRAVVDAFRRHPGAGVVSGGLEIIDEAGRVTGQFPFRAYTFTDQLTHRMVIPQPSTFWRMDVVRAVGSVRTDLHYAMDFEYWVRIGQVFEIVQVSDILAQFRMWEVNKSTAQRARWGPEFLRVLDDIYRAPAVTPQLAALKQSAYGGAYTHGAAWFLAAEDRRSALRWLGHAIQWDRRVLLWSRWWSTAVKTVAGARIHGLARHAKALVQRRRDQARSPEPGRVHR